MAPLSSAAASTLASSLRSSSSSTAATRGRQFSAIAPGKGTRARMSVSHQQQDEEGSSSRSCLVLFTRNPLHKEQPPQRRHAPRPATPGRRRQRNTGGPLPTSPRKSSAVTRIFKHDDDNDGFSEDAALLQNSEPAGVFLGGRRCKSQRRKTAAYEPQLAEEDEDDDDDDYDEDDANHPSTVLPSWSNKNQNLHGFPTEQTPNNNISSSIIVPKNRSRSASSKKGTQLARGHYSQHHLVDLEQRMSLQQQPSEFQSDSSLGKTTGNSQTQQQPSVEHLLTLPKASDRSNLRRQKYDQESPTGGAIPVDHLLQLPKPTDRSHLRRQQYEREGKHMGEFLPEQEPKGIRGQEAKVGRNLPNGEGGSSSEELPKSTVAIRIIAAAASQDEEDDHDTTGDEYSDNVRVDIPPQYKQPKMQSVESRPTGILRPSTRLPSSLGSQPQARFVSPQPLQPRVVTPPSNSNVSFKIAEPPAVQANHSPSDESTNSDINIEQMMDDLMPSFSADPSADTRRIVNHHSLPSSLSMSQQQQQQQQPRQVPPSAFARTPQPPHVTPTRVQAISPSAIESMLTTVAASSPSESLGSFHFFPTMQAQQQETPPKQTTQQQAQSRQQQYHRDIQPTSPMYTTPQAQIKRPAIVSPENSPSEQVEQLNSEAIKHVHKGDYDLALTLFTRVLHMYRSSYGDLHPLVASTFHNLGMVHSKRATFMLDNTLHQGHVRAQSLQCFQAAARTARDSPLLGPNHPNVAVSLVRIGFLLLQSRQYQHAITTFQEALRIRLQAYGPRHGLVANLYNNLGVCYMHTGDYLKGRQFLDMALELQEEQIERLKLAQEQRQADDQEKEGVFITARLELADTLCNIGGLCLEWIRKQGPDARHATDARAAFANAYEIRNDLLGPKHPLVLQVRSLYDMSTSIPLPVSTAVASPKQRPRAGSYKSRIAAVASQPKTIPPIHFSPQEFKLSAEQVAQTLPPLPLRSTVMDSTPWRVQGDKSPSESAGSPSPPPFDDNLPPPMMEVMVSPVRHEDEDDDDRDAVLDETQNEIHSGSEGYAWREPTKIYMSPLHVPPHSHNRNDVTFNSNMNDQLPDLARSSGSETSGSSTSRFNAYDTEESCLIRDSGVECDQGRIHYPSSWSNTGTSVQNDLYGSSDDGDEGVSSPLANSHDIEVVRPYAKEFTNGIMSPDDEILFFLPKPKSLEKDQPPSRETTSMRLRALERESYLSRAKELLALHDNLEPSKESMPVFPRRNTTQHHNSSPTRITDEKYATKYVSEDGTAPLGGNWPSLSDSGSVVKLTQAMIREPELHLRDIHEAGARYLRNNSFVEALQLFEIILDCQRRRHGPLHEDVASAQHNVGIALLRSERLEEAFEAFEAAVRVRKGSLGRDHPEVAVSLVKAGITSLLLHRFEEALWNFREALTVRKHALGALHPSTARIYNNIGCVHVEFNELRDARRAFEAGLDIQRNAMCHEPESGPLMFGTATTLCNLGFLYRSRGMYGKAALVLREAFELQRIVLGFQHPTVLSTLDCLADACTNSSQSVAALRNYNEILTRMQESRNSRGKRRRRAEALLLYKISQVHRQQNDREAQIDKLTQALKTVRTISDWQDPENENELVTRLLHSIQAELKQAKDELVMTPLDWI